MATTYNILVIIEPKQNNQSVLVRAKEFAKATSASIHLLICSNKSKYAPLLKEIEQNLQQEGFKVTSEIAWDDSTYNTILTVQKQQNSLLIIKTHLPDNILKRSIITPQDWKLLRVCPSPILIVNQDRPLKNRPILSAVDLGTTDKKHVELNNYVVEIAETLTHVANGSLHIVSVYPTPIITEIHPDSKMANVTSDIKKIYHNACKKFEEEHPTLIKENIHLKAGAATTIIPEIAQSIDAAVCIIGSISRQGIAGTLIGSTAEAILDDLDCDLLIIKPDSITEELDQLLEQIRS